MAYYLCAMKLLMVCLGNICRSPLAEGIMRQKIEDKGLSWTVDSAGTAGYHIGEPPHKLSQKIASQHGISISNQRCRKLEPKDANTFDAIFVMDRENYKNAIHILGKDAAHKVHLILNFLYPGEDREVPDPWYGEEPLYEEVFLLLDKACNRVLDHLLSEK
ncbi:MAG: low molecular weight phosphotyrosine protein phosphatase [Sediminibacterium sp.]|nr:low molecular weight phosphotyrosine protein phosphatase [Sediminibacterium sp.]